MELLDLHGPATRKTIAAMIEAVIAACVAVGADHEVSYAVRLAVEEASLNILNHGYCGQPGPIALRLLRDDEKIVVILTDSAPSFTPDSLEQPDTTSDWQRREIGGYGWHLIRSMMDGVQHKETADGGNELTLTKNLLRA
ncbi:MAG: ATP-binding protein [Acidobacteriota bacterium]